MRLRGTSVDTTSVRFDGATNFASYALPKLMTGEKAILFLFPDTLSGLPGPALSLYGKLDKQPVGTKAKLIGWLSTPPVKPSF